MIFAQIFTAVAILSGFSSAWPWPPPLSDLRAISGLENLLDRRQNANNDNGGQKSYNLGLYTPSSILSVSPTGTITGNPTNTNKGSTITSLASIAQNAQPGGVNMLLPNTQFGGSQYYAVGATATWVWNYTSLLRTPAHIDVVATVSATAGILQPSPFTLTTNMSFEPTVTFKWDTGAYAEESALPVGLYNLQIYDADNTAGVSAYPWPGKLAPFQLFKFGVYTPQPYYVLTPEFQCATCNAAGGKMERLAWGTLAGFVGITIGTMLWFTGISGVW